MTARGRDVRWEEEKEKRYETKEQVSRKVRGEIGKGRMCRATEAQPSGERCR